MLLRSVFSAGLFFILSGTVLTQTGRFERIGDWASQGRFKEAAGELRRIVEKAEPGRLVAVYYVIPVSFSMRR